MPKSLSIPKLLQTKRSFIFLSGLLILQTIFLYFVFGWGRSTSGGQVACTLEAKICPDGSSVGRSGPKCEFAACSGLAQFVSERYKYTFSYPDSFEQGPVEVSSDAKSESIVFSSKVVSDFSSFSVQVQDGDSEMLRFIRYEQPTGEYVLDGVKGVYNEHKAAIENGIISGVPSTSVRVTHDGVVYTLRFFGISSIKDASIQPILESFRF